MSVIKASIRPVLFAILAALFHLSASHAAGPKGTVELRTDDEIFFKQCKSDCRAACKEKKPDCDKGQYECEKKCWTQFAAVESPSDTVKLDNSKTCELERRRYIVAQKMCDGPDRNDEICTDANEKRKEYEECVKKAAGAGDSANTTNDNGKPKDIGSPPPDDDFTKDDDAVPLSTKTPKKKTVK